VQDALGNERLGGRCVKTVQVGAREESRTSNYGSYEIHKAFHTLSTQYCTTTLVEVRF